MTAVPDYPQGTVAVLTLTDGSKESSRGNVFFLTPGEFVIGRGKLCQFMVDSKKMSTKHARFKVENGDVTVTDLGSTNKTFINMDHTTEDDACTPQQAYPLADGDCIAFGKVIVVHIKFVAKATVVNTTPPVLDATMAAPTSSPGCLTPTLAAPTSSPGGVKSPGELAATAVAPGELAATAVAPGAGVCDATCVYTPGPDATLMVDDVSAHAADNDEGVDDDEAAAEAEPTADAEVPAPLVLESDDDDDIPMLPSAHDMVDADSADEGPSKRQQVLEEAKSGGGVGVGVSDNFSDDDDDDAPAPIASILASSSKQGSCKSASAAAGGFDDDDDDDSPPPQSRADTLSKKLSAMEEDDSPPPQSRADTLAKKLSAADEAAATVAQDAPAPAPAAVVAPAAPPAPAPVAVVAPVVAAPAAAVAPMVEEASIDFSVSEQDFAQPQAPVAAPVAAPAAAAPVLPAVPVAAPAPAPAAPVPVPAAAPAAAASAAADADCDNDDEDDDMVAKKGKKVAAPPAQKAKAKAQAKTKAKTKTKKKVPSVSSSSSSADSDVDSDSDSDSEEEEPKKREPPADRVDWFWQSDLRKRKKAATDMTAWTVYDADTSKAIERAYQQGKEEHKMEAGERTYILTFDRMLQYREDNDNLERPVKRVAQSNAPPAKKQRTS